MKVKIIRLQLNHLWNNEYCMLVSQLVAVFLKFKSEALHLKKSFDRLLACMPELEKIKVQDLSNAISNQLADLNVERHTLIKSIMEHTKIFGKLSMPSLVQPVAVMNRFLNKHGSDIGETNYNDNTKRFNDLMTDLDGNAEIQQAATALQLGIMFDQLRAINTQFANLYLQRSDEYSEVESIDARAIRTETDQALLDFFSAFEFCSVEFEELDYQTPANKMNDLISNYKTQLKARTTRRHEGKAVHTEAPIQVA